MHSSLEETRMSSVLLSLSLSLFAVAQALTSHTHNFLESSTSDILFWGADISSCKSSWKKQNVHPFIVALFKGQFVKGNYMASKRCDISTSIKEGVDHFSVTETWLSAQGG